MQTEPPIHVIGHRNPDTDAICSAIGYAEFLKRADGVEAIAARCGEINARTRFALKEAEVKEPKLLMDVRPKVSDIARTDIIAAHEGESLFEVFNRMREKKLRGLPVLNEKNELLGLASLSMMVDQLLPMTESVDLARIVETTCARLCHVLGGEMLNAVNAEIEEYFILTVAAASAETFQRKLESYPNHQLLVVTGDRPTVQRPAIEYGSRCLIVTGGHKLKPDLLELAREKQVTVISSPHDTAATTLLVKVARNVAHTVEKDVTSFPARTLIRPLREELRDNPQAVFPVLDDQRCLLGVFSKSDLLDPPLARLVLVDHNEFNQAVHGAEEAEIVEVIDHHRLGGGLTSSEPIRFINEPLGSTCTIVARLFKQRGLRPDPGLALVLASGIISDTLHLTSPTTTDFDREILEWLEDISRVNMKGYAERFFAAGSALQVLTTDQVVSADCKKYTQNDWQFAVAQVEELGFDRFWPKKSELATALEAMREKDSLDFACLLVTDITTHDSYLITVGDERLTAVIDYPVYEHRLFHLQGVVSRKKQLLPHLVNLIDKVPKVPAD